MARYEHLPIYKQSLDAATHFEKVVAGFSRYHKYTLGTELRDKSREAVALVVRTYRPRRSVCFFVTRPKLRCASFSRQARYISVTIKLS